MSRTRRFRTLPCLALFIFCAAPLFAQTPLGDSFRVNTDPRATYRSRVAVDDTGGFLVAWYGYNTYWQVDWHIGVPVHRIAARRYLNDGTAAGGEFTIAEHGEVDHYVGSVATNGSSEFLVSYASGNWTFGPTPQAHVTSCDSPGGTTDVVSGIMPLLSEYTPRLEMGVFPSGDFVLVWEEWGWEIFAQCFDVTGAPVSAVVQIGDSLAREPDVAVDASGRGTVVWRGCATKYGDTCTDIYRQRFDAPLNPIGSAEVVNTTSTPDERRHPHIAMNRSGRAVVTWVEDREVNNEDKDRLKLRVYDSAGNAAGPENLMDGFESDIRGTAVAMSSDGFAIILRDLWPAPGYDVIWDTFNSSIASTFRPDSLRVVLTGPDVVVNDADRFVIAWSSSGSTFARIFQLDSQVPVLFAGVTATAVAGGIRLEWSLYADEPVAGFRVYRDDALLASESTLGPDAREFLDATVEPGLTYRYEVAAVMPDGSLVLSMPVSEPVSPAALSLAQNAPNPFALFTRIEYNLERQQPVSLRVYDVEGRLVRVLKDELAGPGPATVAWDGRDGHGHHTASGVYFYRLVAGNRTLTRKMLLLR